MVEAFRGTGLKSLITGAGSAIGGTALGAVAGLGIGFILDKGISLLDDFIHKEEKAIEAGKEAKDTADDIFNKFSTGKSSIIDLGKSFSDSKDDINSVDSAMDSISQKYVELKSGVNASDNTNLSLSADEYQSYIDISNQLADQFPTLVSGYDAQGNAILNLSTNAKAAAQSMMELYNAQMLSSNVEIGNELNVAEAAKQMGMGQEFMTAMFGRLEDYGMHNNIIEDETDGVLKLTDAHARLAEAKAELSHLAKTDPTNSTAIEQAHNDIIAAQRDVDELEENLQYYVENYADNYQQKIESAKTAIQSMNEERKKILASDEYGENAKEIAAKMEEQIRQWADENNLELDAELNVVGIKKTSLEKLQDSGKIQVDLNYDIDTMSTDEIDSKIDELTGEKNDLSRLMQRSMRQKLSSLMPKFLTFKIKR